MLLNTGNTNVQQLLAGNVSGKKIKQIAVGTSDTAVTAADTTLTGMIAKDVTSVNYLTGNVVEFVSALESGDASILIKEVGLIDDDGALVHRKVVSPFNRVTGTVTSLVYRVKIR